MIIAKPTDASAAATVKTKRVKTWPEMSSKRIEKNIRSIFTLSNNISKVITSIKKSLRWIKILIKEKKKIFIQKTSWKNKNVYIKNLITG